MAQKIQQLEAQLQEQRSQSAAPCQSNPCTPLKYTRDASSPAPAAAPVARGNSSAALDPEEAEFVEKACAEGEDMICTPDGVKATRCFQCWFTSL